VHGKSSKINLVTHPIFNDIGDSISVARYHSLKVSNLPESLSVLADYETMPMVIMDESNKVAGFQFHPESILTTAGTKLLNQTINYLLN
jgi:anthranilate synthase component 2